MPKYKVTVTQTAEDICIDHDDWEEFGLQGEKDFVLQTEVIADNEENAMDTFNEEQPIALPENYTVDYEEL